MSTGSAALGTCLYPDHEDYLFCAVSLSLSTGLAALSSSDTDPGRLEQLPWEIPPHTKANEGRCFYVFYMCAHKRETCEREYTPRGLFFERKLHTKQNENTYGGSYTSSGLHTIWNENKREAESTLGTVETERAIHGGSRERKGTNAGDYIRKGLRMKVRTWLYCLRSGDL